MTQLDAEQRAGEKDGLFSLLFSLAGLRQAPITGHIPSFESHCPVTAMPDKA